MKIPQPIPYQGSKRGIAKTILSFFPHRFDTLIEPFAGSAAVTIAASTSGKSSKFHINDVNIPLMELWNEIINNPQGISDGYKNLWNDQKGREKEFYFEIRDKFNETKRADYFLYLLARCIKASIRYNSNGNFNQSPDNRRKGRNPQKMRNDVFMVSKLLRNRIIITSEDYKEVLKKASKTDLIYMDPPYQGVCSGGDPRYYKGIQFDEFVSQIKGLIERDISFILSYDGRKGEKIYGKEIPTDIGIKRIELRVGRSTQSTLLGKNEITYESLYLPYGLARRLGVDCDENVVEHRKLYSKQSTLPLKRTYYD